MRNRWNGAFQLLGQLAVVGGVMFGLLSLVSQETRDDHL